MTRRKAKIHSDADKYLKGITFDMLDQVASAMSDSEAARNMNELVTHCLSDF